jgi:hypothetical protein
MTRDEARRIAVNIAKAAGITVAAIMTRRRAWTSSWRHRLSAATGTDREKSNGFMVFCARITTCRGKWETALADPTQRQQIVLAALAAEPAASFAPVQVQKLFFLLDQNVAGDLGGQQFSFEPYDYGPFDRAVYLELERLAQQGLVAIESSGGAERRTFSLTPAGHAAGTAALNQLQPRARDYMSRVSAWVRSLSFAELVGAIYNQYPAMKANSVFRG